MSERARKTTEVALSFVVATALASTLYRMQGIPFIRANLHALIAAVFLLLPQIVLRGQADLAQYGFTSRPRLLGLSIAAAAIVLILPVYAGAFVLVMRELCLRAPALVPGSCFHLFHPRLRLPPDFAMLVAAQVIVVALPEELFFRGYVQGRLEEVWPSRWKVLGAPLGVAWLAQAVLFGFGHYFVTFEPQMLTRFFPALVFGWMFARTRSIFASTLFHAACNLLMDVLASSLFR